MAEEPWVVTEYQDIHGCRPIREWLSGLPVEDRDGVMFVVELLSKFALGLAGEYVKQTDGHLWELRIMTDSVRYRVIYAAVRGHKFLLLHGFRKSTKKTPEREIRIAADRLTDYLERTSQEERK